MNSQDFETKMRSELGIPDISDNSSLPPYRIGSDEPIKTNQNTVDLILMLFSQGMAQRQIAREMYMGEASVSRILNGVRNS